MKIVHNGRELSKVLKAVSSRLEHDEMSEVMKKLSVDGFRELVERSARDTGFLRSNWGMVVDENAPNAVLHNPHPSSKARGVAATEADARYIYKDIDGITHVTLYNNTAYAAYLEHGTPRMRAQPMVEPTYRMLLSAARRLALYLSKKRDRS